MLCLYLWDFSIPIDVILIEILGDDPQKEQLCRDLLLSKGYNFKMKCYHNEIFIKDTN